MKYTTIILVFLITGMTVLYGQPPFIYTDELTYKNGLDPVNNYSLVVYQDRKGFIWIAGSDGLQRYDGYEFTVYNDQLNFINVFNIIEDRNGILWISTLNGIYLFNPENEKFIHYLPDSTFITVYRVIEDMNGIIWCATSNGLLKLERKSEKEVHINDLIFTKGIASVFNVSLYKLNENGNTAGANQIWEICKDSRNVLWIGSPMGLYIFQPRTNEFIRMDVDATGKTRLINQAVHTLREENPEVLWVGTNGGIARLSNLKEVFYNNEIKKLNLEINLYPDHYRWAQNQGPFLQFFFDSQHNFWTGTHLNGLVRIKFEDNQKVEFQEVYKELQDPRNFEFNDVRSIMEDRTGLLWIGHAYPMIKRIRPGNNIFTTLQRRIEKNFRVRYDFNQLYEDEDENLWICTWGTGLFKITRDGKVSNFINHISKDTLANQTVSLLEIKKGIFWVGTSVGIWQLDTHTGKWQKLFATKINGMTDRIIKVGDFILINGFNTDNVGMWLYNMNTNELVNCLTEILGLMDIKFSSISGNQITDRGEIWFMKENRGLVKISINQITGEFSSRRLPESVASKVQQALKGKGAVTIIYEDKKGNLWMYSPGLLIELDPNKGDIRKWTVSEGLFGLSRYNIVSVEEDNDGNLWLAGDYVLSVLDPATGKIRNLDIHDGLPELRHSGYCRLKDSKGLLYFGGWGSLYSFNPSGISYNKFIPPVVITDFKLFGKTVKVDTAEEAILTRNISYTRGIELDWNQNNLSFTFAALDYNDPIRNKYAYMLDGYQDEWIETDASNRIATYTNLNPGKYVFRVKGSNHHGTWNEEGTYIDVIIHPPFWKTTLAHVVYGCIFLLLLRAYIIWRIWQFKKEKIMLEKQVSERTHLIERQKTELLNQKEELQSALENLQNTQEQLIESEKMAALGTLVAGVSHEINTPVGIGVTAISLLLEDVKKIEGLFKKDEISKQDFNGFMKSTYDAGELIQKNLERTADIIQSFKLISVDQLSEQKRVFNLRCYLDDIIRGLSPKINHKEIVFDIDCDDSLDLNSYPGVYAQVFTNLLLNTITHGFHDKKQGTITIRAKQKNDTLRIEYLDDGIGISKKDLPHIFEPFYTSEKQLGTGLGLNIVYNLVKRILQGNISCESEPGKGVLFLIEVPV